MKQIELKNFAAGNFSASIVIEPSEEVYDFFAREGATRFFQNGVLPKWEKNEAIRLGLWPKNAKGVPERPKPINGKPVYTRENIAFSEEGSKALFALISDATTPIDGKAVSVGVVDVNVGENSDYTGTITFLEQWLATPNKKDGSPRTVEQFANKIGSAVPSEPWGENNTFLAAAKEWMAAQD